MEAAKAQNWAVEPQGKNMPIICVWNLALMIGTVFSVLIAVSLFTVFSLQPNYFTDNIPSSSTSADATIG
jgi:hypothetical protein